MSFKDTIIDDHKRHVAFRRSYWLNQTRHITYMSLGVILLSIILFIGMLFTVYKGNVQAAYIKYGVGLSIGIVGFAWGSILLKNKKISVEKRARYSEYLTLYIGITFLSWGLISMDISAHDVGMPDAFPYFIGLSIIAAFFFLPGHHYAALIIITSVGFVGVLLAHKTYVKPGVVVEYILSAGVLFRLGQIHYIYGRNNFETHQQNKNLIEETEASNEELIAINEELTNATARLEDALEKVKASADYQKAFSANLSHDMRAPLNGIIGTVQVMLMNKDLTEEQKEDLEVCMTSGKTLLSLVNDVLDYSKIEAGQMEIIPVDFDLHEVVNAVNGMFRVQAEKKGLVYKFEIADDTPCSLYADDFRIQQVISNIVSNAVKYTDCGGVTLSVSVDEGGTLIIKVADTGQGISEEGMKDLFVPFKRINEKSNKHIQGTGLGMAIVHHTVEKMDGSIEVKSTVGEGSVFTIYIPVTIRNREITWKNEAKKKTEVVRETDLTGKRILYIDDTAVNLKIVSKMLKGTGAEVELTSKPLEGLKYLSVKKYDLLLVDHLMPDIDGEELFRRLRESEGENKNIPAIILTGNSGAGIEEHYARLGFAGYITKPIMRDLLLSVIEESLG